MKKAHVKCFRLVLSICVLQFILIVHLFVNRESSSFDSNQFRQDLLQKEAEIETNPDFQLSSAASVASVSLTSSFSSSSSSSISISNAELQGHVKTYRVAAVFLNLHQPTWFQRRYSMMIQNVDSNIPVDWVIQIFWTAEGQSKAGIDINWGGLHRLVESGRMVLTTIPKDVFAQKRKKFELMVEPWIWENMLSDTVFLFGGTSVICSNSPYRITNFTQWDYIGSPWSFKKGVGGDGAK